MSKEECLKLAGVEEFGSMSANPNDQTMHLNYKSSDINLYSAMDCFAEQQSIAFFKWNTSKTSTYIEYLTKISKLVRSQEIETALNEFEGMTIEERYQLFIKQNQ